MIVSENITLQLDTPISNTQIENALLTKGVKPLRWAIIGGKDKTFTISVSYDKKC